MKLFIDHLSQIASQAVHQTKEVAPKANLLSNAGRALVKRRHAALLGRPLPEIPRFGGRVLQFSKSTSLALMAFACLASSAFATSYYVDTAAQFNAKTDKFSASFSTLKAGDRVYLKGGTSWAGIDVTLNGSMTDAQAQSNPAIIYACDSSYNPTPGGVTVDGVSQLTLAGSGIVFTGVTFSSKSGMVQSGTYSDISNDANAHLIATAGTSRYMTISHVKFDHCGLLCTSTNDHNGPWINVEGYHHTIQYCDFQGRDFNPKDSLPENSPYNGYNRTSIHGPTIIFGKDSSDTLDWGYHSVRYNYFGERKVPDSGGSGIYTPADGTLPSALDNGWETIRIGVGSLSIYDFNVTVEYNTFYHAIQGVAGSPTENVGEPEMISNKSRKNIIRYNTILNNYGSVTLRQGDYCVVQGNYFLAGGAYDANGNIILTEQTNTSMGGVRVFGFGHTVANNYFYKISGNNGASVALILGEGGTPTLTGTNLNNAVNGTTSYETANYSQILGNTFIDCNALNLDDPDFDSSNTVYGTQFINNLIYYSSNISAAGVIGKNTDALTNHGGLARGNYIYSASSSQFGNASTMLGTGSNTITTSANPLMTGTFDVLTVPASGSPVIGSAQALPTINDTSTTGTSTHSGILSGNVATYGGLDLRGLTRPPTGRDIGDYEAEATGTSIRPLHRYEVGIVTATYPNYPAVSETFSDNKRDSTGDGNNPPRSLIWYFSGVTASCPAPTSGTMTMTTTSARHVVAYFPTQTLNVGDVLTLSYNFSVTTPRDTSKGLRAALLYSGTAAGARISADSTDPPTITSTGYGTFMNPAPSVAGSTVALVERSGSGTLITTSTPYASPLATGGTNQSLVAGTVYTAKLTIQKTGTSQVTLNTTYSGGALSGYSVTGTDSVAIDSQFDTLAFGVAATSGTAAVASASYSNISLIKTTPLAASTGTTSGLANSTVDVDLRPFVSDTQNIYNAHTFTLGSATNGTVALLSDGYTARFTPTTGYVGSAASFAYTVSNGSASASGLVNLTIIGGSTPATVTLGSLAQTYDGSPKAATATTSPAGLTVDLTYNGSSTAPTTSGSYTVIGAVNDPIYSGSATGTLVISKAAATVTLGNLLLAYDGTPKSASYTTSPGSYAVILTYNGSSTAPSAVGSYSVLGTINDTNYAGSASGTLVITGTVTTLTTSGTQSWIAPANVTSIQVECWGGGGAGGSAVRGGSGAATGGGGAGGAYAKLNAYAVTPGVTYYINVGAPGVSGTADGVTVSGSDSWFNSVNSASSTIIAKGGAGGQSAVTGTTDKFGIGGTATAAGSIGDVVNKGGNGFTSSTTASGGGGGGSGGSGNVSGGNIGMSGTSNLGAAAVTSGVGGNGGNANATSGSSGDGQLPTTPPGGGGGGARAASTTQRTGGTGKVGQVILTILPTPPSITSSLSTTGTIGNAFSYQITASNSPTSYNATSLPAGLSVNTSTGLISGTTSASGSSSVTISGSNSWGTGSASLTITVLSRLESWRQFYFGTTANTGNAADTADPDGDGLNNLVEWAYGLNPLVSDATALVVSGTAISQRGTAVVSLANTQSGVDYRAMFGRRKDYVTAGLTYTVQFSSDLSTWENSTATPTVIASDTEIDAVTVPYPFFLNTGAKAQFFRVSITSQ